MRLQFLLLWKIQHDELVKLCELYDLIVIQYVLLCFCMSCSDMFHGGTVPFYTRPICASLAHVWRSSQRTVYASPRWRMSFTFTSALHCWKLIIIWVIKKIELMMLLTVLNTHKFRWKKIKMLLNKINNESISYVVSHIRGATI